MQHISTRSTDGFSEQSSNVRAGVRRILIVDDQKVVALALQAGLAKLPDCEIAVATNSEQALRLFEEQVFDLMITDYKMPGTDGIELATRVRQAYPETAIIVITSYVGDVLYEQASRARIQRILEKPIGLAEIRREVLAALGG